MRKWIYIGCCMVLGMNTATAKKKDSFKKNRLFETLSQQVSRNRENRAQAPGVSPYPAPNIDITQRRVNQVKIEQAPKERKDFSQKDIPSFMKKMHREYLQKEGKKRDVPFQKKMDTTKLMKKIQKAQEKIK